MIQCKDCELYKDGQTTCDPAVNIKEPECLLKWQLLILDNLDRRIEQSNAFTLRMMPRIEKLLEAQERASAGEEDADSWKHGGADEDKPVAS